jgi:stress response protein SCP2
MLTEHKKIRTDADFIFYNQPETADKAIQLVSQSLEQQQFAIVLNKIPSEIKTIAFVLTLHEAKQRLQNFSQLETITLTVNQADHLLATYVLEKVAVETALILAELYRYNNDWKFRAVGQGFIEGLDVLARYFGVEIDEAPPPVAKNAHNHERQPVKPPTVVRYIEAIKPSMPAYQEKVTIAKRDSVNESKTRLLIDLILTKALGYALENISTEHKIARRTVRADYMLSLNGKNVLVVEAKAITEPLKETYISQVTAYAYYSQLDFALLTNSIEWQLYYIERKKLKKYLAHQVFAINLLEFNDAVGEKLFWISRFGINENTLEMLKLKMKALNSIPEVILQEAIVKHITETINQQHAGCQITPADVLSSLKNLLD